MAYGKHVVCKKKYDAYDISENAYCPMCNCKIKSKTCGFYNCFYKFDGIKETGEKVEHSMEKNRCRI